MTLYHRLPFVDGVLALSLGLLPEPVGATLDLLDTHQHYNLAEGAEMSSSGSCDTI